MDVALKPEGRTPTCCRELRPGKSLFQVIDFRDRWDSAVPIARSCFLPVIGPLPQSTARQHTDALAVFPELNVIATVQL
jgi:hypothetical protein